MTAQIPEVLRFESREYALCTEPLESWFELMDRKSPFRPGSTANWRGYVGTWEVRDQRLYLVGLRGKDDRGANVGLESFFPGYPERVYAHWYSGTARLPEGELRRYVHGGYASTYARDRLLRFERGVLVETTLRHNDEAPGVDAEDEDEGYVLGAMTHLPSTSDEAGPRP